jgi:hypothetical protein
LDHGRIRALGDELSRLMKEQSESLEEQVFIGINQQELQRQEQRLKRIREVSADLIAAWNESLGVPLQFRKKNAKEKAWPREQV